MSTLVRTIRWILISALILPVLPAALADTTAKTPTALGARAHTAAERPLEVRGQNRRINMMRVKDDERTKIYFVKPRKDFRDQILSTVY